MLIRTLPTPDISTANPDTVQITNPDAAVINHDISEVVIVVDAEDEEYVNSFNVIILHIVVEPQNSEVPPERVVITKDEQKKIDRKYKEDVARKEAEKAEAA